MHKFRKSASKAGFATLALSLGALLFTATAAQAAVNANTTEFFYQGSTPGSPPVALTGTQASTQVFNIQLPSTGFGTGGTQGGSCADAGGTGATIDSFLVPEGTNLSALTYPSGNPQPNQGTALAPAGVNGYVAQSSPEASPPGLIATNYLDNLEMATLVATGRGADGYTVQGTQLPGAGAALIPSGQSNAQFEAGVVCFGPSGVETDYFTSPVCFSTSSSDANGFTWLAGACPGSGPVVPEAPLAVGLPVGGAAILGAAVFINRRRRHGPNEVAMA